jgi:hypothetical protein
MCLYVFVCVRVVHRASSGVPLTAKAWNGASTSEVVSGTSTLGLRHNDQMV